MDSRDRLVGSNSPHVNLALQLLPAGQDDMQEDNPITCHFEPKASLVAAGLDFLRFTEDGRHARMRHICLNGDVRSRDCSRRRIGQPDNHNRADPGRRRGDFVFNRDCVRRVRWSRAGCDKHTRAQAHNRRLRHSFGEGEPAARSVERGIPCCSPGGLNGRSNVPGSFASGSFRGVLVAPFASAGHVPLLTLGRKHVVVHSGHHGDKHH